MNTYNLTAHFSESKTVYCALCTEAVSGRSGNDLASALYKILGKVADEHEFTEIVLWVTHVFRKIEILLYHV